MNKQIEQTLDLLEKYGVRRSYAKFLCLDSDDTAVYQVKLSEYNYKDKYTKEFKPTKFTFTFSVIGLNDFFPSMPVMDLITDKGVNYCEVRVNFETTIGLEKKEECIDVFGFDTQTFKESISK